MTEERVERALDLIEKLVVARGGMPHGLSDDEIREIKDDQPSPLPRPYRRYLSRMGGGAWPYPSGSQSLYPGILGAWRDARDLLRENEVRSTSPTATGSSRYTTATSSISSAGARPTPRSGTTTTPTGLSRRPGRTGPSPTGWSAASRRTSSPAD